MLPFCAIMVNHARSLGHMKELKQQGSTWASQVVAFNESGLPVITLSRSVKLFNALSLKMSSHSFCLETTKAMLVNNSGL